MLVGVGDGAAVGRRVGDAVGDGVGDESKVTVTAVGVAVSSAAVASTMGVDGIWHAGKIVANKTNNRKCNRFISKLCHRADEYGSSTARYLRIYAARFPYDCATARKIRKINWLPDSKGFVEGEHCLPLDNLKIDFATAVPT